MWKFIRFELKYWLKTPMVWIFLLITSLITFGAVASDSVMIGGSVGNVFRNAPFVIQNFYCILSFFFGLLMTTAFMNATASRDYQYGMSQFIFSSPIKKADYFFGKFIGAIIVSVIPLLGVTIGSLIAPVLAPLFGWTPEERFGGIIWEAHLNGILAFGIPNVIIAGSMLYGLAIIFRSSTVSFISAIVMLLLYQVSLGYTSDIKNEWLANILDPFGITPYRIMTKYLTVNERNFQAVPLSDELLSNRLIWIGIGVVILLLIHWKFSFDSKKEKVRKQKTTKLSTAPVVRQVVYESPKELTFPLSSFFTLFLFELRAIIRNPSFIIITSIGMIFLMVGLRSFTGTYGTDQYPVTYDVVNSIQGNIGIFMYAFIVFYAGVLVWKERDARFNEILDSSPVLTAPLFFSKLLALVAAMALVLFASMIVGILAQALHGYYRLELDVYFKSLFLLELTSYTFMAILALLFQYIVNNRYIAYFAFVLFLILNDLVWSLLDVNTNMLVFGATPSVTYSDMNGFGPFVEGAVWFNAYWAAFSAILCLLCLSLYIRGKESGGRVRLYHLKTRMQTDGKKYLMALGIFAIIAGFVFYNTQVLNEYDAPEESEDMLVDYEKTYKKYENLPQPRFYKLDYNIEVYPDDRSLIASVDAWARNMSGGPIKEIHMTMPNIDSIQIQIPGSRLKLKDKRLYYRIYALDKPLAPGDSVKLNVRIWKLSEGFENEVSFTQLTANGTFFNNADIMPSFGYNSNYEMSDREERKKRKLPVRPRMPKLDLSNLTDRSNNYISNDADWVEVNTVISTKEGHIAVAPGSLVKKWTKEGRTWYNYRLDQKAVNFYSFVSADYEVAREKWNGIDLEVYYDRKHAYNVPNMLRSMRKSLEYYTTHFGPYMHKQCRIIEFPRYAGFAQAFPGTMPYSESIGFITDLRGVDQDDIDMVFYVVAHEMGHQYFAHQLIGARMQGSEMMSEGFSQYAALMVMEKEYGKPRMKQFLEYEMDDYLSSRSMDPEGENPLMLTESQQYIHYQKASVVMYYLKEMIGEQQVNKALSELIRQYGYKEPPYPTSLAAVQEFRKVTPDSLQYLIEDMFEKITLFSNRMLSATVKKKGDLYEVTVKTSSEKFRADKNGQETAIPLKDYIDIAIFAAPTGDDELGEELLRKRVRITKKENTFTFTVNKKPSEAGIDPYNYLIDRVPDDNIKAVTE